VHNPATSNLDGSEVQCDPPSIEEERSNQCRPHGLTVASEDCNWQSSRTMPANGCCLNTISHDTSNQFGSGVLLMFSERDKRSEAELKVVGPVKSSLKIDASSLPRKVCSKHDVEAGDLIFIDRSAARAHRNCRAVITKVHEAHCTATVLDETLSGIEEIWPSFPDILLISSCWRVGVEVVLSGLKNPKIKALNGTTGIIVSHVRQGHPSFVQKGESNIARLSLCVRISLSNGSERCVLLSPQFLKTRQEFFLSVAQELGRIIEDL